LPAGFGARPPITGWFAEFGELTAPPGSEVGYTRGRDAFHGRDVRSLRSVSLQCDPANADGKWDYHRPGWPPRSPRFKGKWFEGLAGTVLADAELLNPLGEGPHARFLAFRDSRAQRWCADLLARGCVTDVRGDVLRIGFGLYHDEEDVDAFAALATQLT
jgi:hypothetical protein